MAERRAQTSPVLRAIRHITCHPDEEPGAPDTSRLTHSWNLLTGRAHPEGIRAPLRERHNGTTTSAGALHPAGVVLTTTVAVLVLLAASKAGSSVEGIRDAVQHKWAALEGMVMNAAASTARGGQHAARKVKAQAPRAKRVARRFAPVVLGLLAVTWAARAHQQGDLRRAADSLQPRLEAAQQQVTSTIDELTSQPGFARRAAAFVAAVAACGVMQCVNTHKSALGAPDPYKRARKRVQSATRATGTTSDKLVRARCTHAAMLGLMAFKSLRQPMSEDSKRRGLAIVAAGAVAAEYSLRRGTARELPVRQMRARMQRMRTRTGARTKRLRAKASRGLASARADGSRIPTSTAAVSAVVLLAASFIVSGPGKHEVQSPALPAKERQDWVASQRQPAKESTKPAKAQLRATGSSTSSLAAMKAEQPATQASAQRQGLDQIAAPALRPSLLLLAVVGCDVAMQEHSVLRRVAPEKRVALQQRAPTLNVPAPLAVSGMHVRRAASGAWRRLSRLMSKVPAHLPDGQGKPATSLALNSTGTTEATDGVVSVHTLKPKQVESPQASPRSDALGAQLEAASPRFERWPTKRKVVSVSAAQHIRGARVVPATAGELTEVEEWMSGSLALAGAVPEHDLSKESLRGLEELRSARAQRLQPIHQQLDALVDALPAQLDEALPSLFEAADGVHSLDHGNNGLSLAPAKQAANLWRTHMDECPGQFVEEDVVPELAATVAAVAKLAGANPQDCFPGSTPANVLTTLLSALAPAGEGSVLVFSNAEGATRAVVGRCAAKAGLSIVEMQISKDMLADGRLLQLQLADTLQACERGLRAVVLPHVLSFPPVVMPVADLVATCKQHDIVTIVDGTHALGNIPVNLNALKADAYVASCSTWLGAARSAALGWVAEPLQAQVAPLVGLQRTGRGLHADSLLEGPADVCAWLSAGTALAVAEKYGHTQLQERRQRLLRAGVRTLVADFEDSYESEAARTKAVFIDGAISSGRSLGARSASSSESLSGMAAVQLPHMPDFSATVAGAHALRMRLRRRGIEVPVHAWEGALWVRVSGALHTTPVAFEALASALWVLGGSRKSGTAALHAAVVDGSLQDTRTEVESSIATPSGTRTEAEEQTDGSEHTQTLSPAASPVPGVAAASTVSDANGFDTNGASQKSVQAQSSLKSKELAEPHEQVTASTPADNGMAQTSINIAATDELDQDGLLGQTSLLSHSDNKLGEAQSQTDDGIILPLSPEHSAQLKPGADQVQNTVGAKKKNKKRRKKGASNNAATAKAAETAVQPSTQQAHLAVKGKSSKGGRSVQNAHGLEVGAHPVQVSMTPNGKGIVLKLETEP